MTEKQAQDLCLVGLVRDNLLRNTQKQSHGQCVQQMHWLNMEIQLKQPDPKHCMLLQHSNKKPHVANLIKNAIQVLSGKVLLHLLYSPDIAPLIITFQLLSNSL
uniref:Uncharacterized protein n=1 Tax=Octopus bimaculoides TaxID=37653 RepID=A0A0L8FPY9_OCTBM